MRYSLKLNFMNEQTSSFQFVDNGNHLIYYNSVGLWTWITEVRPTQNIQKRMGTKYLGLD